MITEKEKDQRIKELQDDIEELEKKLASEQESVDSDRQSLKERETRLSGYRKEITLRIVELELLIDYYKKNPNIFVNPSERKNCEPKQKKS